MKILTITLLLLTTQVLAYGPAKPDAAKKAAYQANKLLKREAYLRKAARPASASTEQSVAERNAAANAIATNYELAAAAAKLNTTAAAEFAHNFDPR